MITRELLLSQLSCFVTDVLIEGEEVLENVFARARVMKLVVTKRIGNWLRLETARYRRKKSIITVTMGVIVDGAS